MRKSLLLLFGVLFCWTGAIAQGTIDTYAVYPNNNGSSAVSFEVESTTPIEITDIANVWNNGTSSTDIWIKVGGITTTSSPLDVSAANGWSMHQTAATVAGNGTSPVSIQNLIPISIPANTPVGIVITGGMSYSGTNGAPPSPTSFVHGPVTLRTGGTKGYGGVVPNLVNNPRGFLGTMSYVLGVQGNCTPFSNFAIDSITGTAAKIDWTPGAGNTSFYLEYGAAGFTPGTGTTVSGTYPGPNPPVIVTGLSPQTTYDVYFGEICNTGADSVYFPTPQQFTTTKACSSPSNFAVSNVATTSADFSWSVLGAPGSFNIIYGASGFDPATSGTVFNASGSPATISTLSGSTDYDAYIYADCGVDGLSDTIGPISFRTNCVIYTAPITENFDGPVWIPRNGIDPCWTTTPAAGTTWSWEPRALPPTSGNGPLSDYTGGNFMYCEASISGTLPDAELVTPPIDVSGLTTPALYFQQHRFSGATIADMSIEVSNDFGTNWSQVYTVSGDIQTSNSEPWVLEFVNLGAYVGDTIMVRFLQQFNGCCGDAAIDSVVVDEAPACPWPTNVNYISSTSTTANIGWTDPTGSAWGLEWGPTGFAQGTGTTGNSTGTNYNITGLTPNTIYDVYVRTDCSGGGNGNSIWIGPITFTTQCAPFTAPYFNGFELDPQDVAPTCWSSYFTGVSANVEVEDFTGTAAPYAGSQALYLYSGNSSTTGADTLVAISPQFSDLTASDKRIRFFANSDGVNSRLIVGTISGLTPGSTFTPLDTITFALPDTYEEVIVNFDAANGYNGTDEYIVLAHSMGATFQYVRIDDFNYEDIPSCIGSSVSSLGANGLGPNGATAFWAGGQGDFTRVYWGLSGFTPGSGIGTALTLGTDSTYMITGLSPQTTYDFYIQDSCIVGGSGTIIGPFTFSTTCLPTTAPYFEDFDASVWVPRNGIDPCWTTIPAAGSTWSWEPRSAAPTSGNGPLNDATGTNFMYCEASIGGTFPDAQLISPAIDVSSLNIPAVYFRQHRFSGATIADMGVDVSNDFGASWTNVYSVTGDIQTSNSASWVEQIIPLTSFIGDTITVRFTQTFNGCCGDAAIDSFAVAEAPSCPDLIGLGLNVLVDTSATISWGANPNASQYEVWFGPAGFYQGSQTTGGVKGNASSSSLLIDTLSQNTCYEFLVRYTCGPGDTANWVGPFQFCTPCSPTTIPYLETYDIWPLNCWQVDLGGQDWVQYTGVGGDNYAEASFWSFNNVDMVMRSLPIHVTQDAWLKFDWSHQYNATYPNDQLIIRAQVNGSSPWDTLVNLIGPIDFNDPTAAATIPGQFINHTQVLDPLMYTGNTVVFEVIGNSDFGPDVFVNNFIVEKIPTCFEPVNLGVSNVGFNDAKLTWDAGATGQSGNFQVSIGVGISTPGAGTLTLVNGADSLVATGLSSNTGYCYFVREICATGDTSNWSGPVCFNTECTSYTAPFFEDFESHTLGFFDGKDNCWTLASSNTNMTSNTSGYSWELRNVVQTSSGGTGASGDHTLYPAIGGQFFNADVSYGVAGDSSVLISPIIDISTLTSPQLQYHYHRFGTNMAELHVDVYDGTNWVRGLHSYTSLVGGQTSNADAWSDTILDLTPYIGLTNFQVRFRTVSNGCCPGDNGLDDILISDPLSCLKPINLTAANIGTTDADLSWSSDNGNVNGNYQISYGLNLSDPALGTTSMVNMADSVQLTGLTASSAYCYYVREICAAGDTSLWSGPYCFNTQCIAVIAPFSEDFENHTLGFFDGENNCWTIINTNPNMTSNTSGYSWELRNAVQTTSGSTGASGDNTLYPAIGGQFFNADVSYGVTGDTSVLQSPIIDISGLTNPELRYHLHRFGTNMAEFHVDIYDGTNWNRGVHSYTSLVGTQTANGDPWTDTTVSLLPYAGATNLQIRFRTVSNGCCPGDNGLDDVSVGEAGNNCTDPTGLDTANASCTSVDLIWNSGPATIASALEWGPSGFTPGGGGTIVAPATSPTNITVTPGTSYDFYVVDFCATDTSGVVGPFTFTTPSGPITAAFTPSLGAPTLTDLTATFDASASVGATTYTWDFGDGNTGTGANAQNIYTANGTYDVKLVISGPCGMDSITQQVIIAGVSLVENRLGRSLELYPNPARESLNLAFVTEGSDDARISIIDLTGKTIIKIEESNLNGRFEGQIDISTLAKGTYLLKVESGDLSVQRRVIKQ